MSANSMPVRFACCAGLLLAVVLSGCAATSSKYPTSFKTRLSDAGLKHFELRIAGLNYRPEQRPNSNTRQSATSVSKQHKKNRKTMIKAAEELIEQNQFCRDGFWVLDFDIDVRGHFLRGECNEQATAEDRSRFPDTIRLW